VTADAGLSDTTENATPESGATDSSDATEEAATTGDAAPGLAWMPCQGTFECATLDAPRGDPGGPTLQIAVIRHKASSAESRLGVLLFNPGGPGAPSVDGIAGWYVTLATQLGSEVLDRFDFVSFDWRGLGRSRPSIDCGGDSTVEALANVDLAASRPIPPGYETAVANFTAACTAGTDSALLARLDSESVAHDMEVLRNALGEEKINYLGLSHGTWLGAIYATLFPTHTRAFVLDSNLAPQTDRRGLTRDLARGVEEALPEFFAWCDGSGSSMCKLTSDVGTATTAEAFDKIIKQLEATPMPVGARRLTALSAMQATRNLLMGGGPGWQELALSLSQTWKGDGLHLLNQGDATFGRDQTGHYNGGFATARAILAVEPQFPAGFTTDDYVAFRAELAATFPRAGAYASGFDLINLRWPVKPAFTPTPIAAPTAPPLLLLGGKHDPATNFDQTLRLQTALANGSYVVEAEGEGHSQMSQNKCAAAAAAAFFVDPTKAPAMTSCPSMFP
jgi:pimeloyl-ACP methyl ester carboxylesterase